MTPCLMNVRECLRLKGCFNEGYLSTISNPPECGPLGAFSQQIGVRLGAAVLVLEVQHL